MTHARAITLLTHRVEQTLDIGRAVAAVCRQGDVIALVGELGAGKTQLTRGLAAGLGADERAVCSPTFVLMQEYATQHEPGPLLHIDAYRIDSFDELETTGWTAELAAESVSVIEWADRIAGQLPRDHLRIRLEHAGPSDRRITLDGMGAWAGRGAALAERLEGLSDVAADALDPDVRCPVCRAAVSKAVPTFPFCSTRCRQVDLGRWLDGRHVLIRDIDWENDEL
ncbi:MAG: tRNA (adenosine(37)-N6)-threonylcarbamoyltransferase complex ATPase subunit type 1 TsaE [Alphaproteobacteria bacterium]|jgi:tRNA threonylcarbamoyladenosine biosynthesis protein TsaE|nr:tRNA (adenosine(37)-N6)-threonylcarbamoyltransferase complex ATPase subunit type 1 TsaE [Alphaproteobacteria bacterium]